MNFYKHHIGDYAQATSHLSFIEDAAYSRLIRKYYADEKPLPQEVSKVQRLVGARTREERAAVETVLNEFFTLTDDGWRNKRCDEEIELAMAASESSEERRENERERQKRHREERSKLFAVLAQAGVHLPFNTKTETLRSRVTALAGHAVVTDSSRVTGVTRNGLATAIQTPDSRHQTPDVDPLRSSSPVSMTPSPSSGPGRAAGSVKNDTGGAEKSRRPRERDPSPAEIAARRAAESAALPEPVRTAIAGGLKAVP